MKQTLAMHEIKIGDLIEVKWNKQFKIYKLNDVACWSKDHSIKTIDFVEHELRYWSHDWKNKSEYLKHVSKLRKNAKIAVKDGDKILINCTHDSVPYVIFVNLWNKKEMRGVHFRKMTTT